MNLRVFQGLEDSLGVEVSSPALDSEIKWFVPLWPIGSPQTKGVNPNYILDVMFREQRFRVPFMLIRTVFVSEGERRPIGQLDEKDSIDILNNIYDRLASDRPTFDPLKS